jgi:hypothetical protein
VCERQNGILDPPRTATRRIGIPAMIFTAGPL